MNQAWLKTPEGKGCIMIYEIRTYKLKPGSVPELERRAGERMEWRRKFSPLAGFFHSEIGPLNEIMHIWPYKNEEDRYRIRTEVFNDTEHWPPAVAEFILVQQSEILVPFHFLPEIKPGKIGPYFEVNCVNIVPETAKALMMRWEQALPARMKLSPLVLAGMCEFGQANRFIHIWAYRSLDERMSIKEQARQAGIWPPPGDADSVLAQENKILLPAAFSPLQ